MHARYMLAVICFSVCTSCFCFGVYSMIFESLYCFCSFINCHYLVGIMQSILHQMGRLSFLEVSSNNEMTLFIPWDVSFKRSYEKSPTVLVTAKHSIKGGKVAIECNGIVSWIEVIQRAVIKEKSEFTIPKIIEARYLCIKRGRIEADKVIKVVNLRHFQTRLSLTVSHSYHYLQNHLYDTQIT